MKVYVLGGLYDDVGEGGFAIRGVFATEDAAIAAYERIEATRLARRVPVRPWADRRDERQRLFRVGEDRGASYDGYAIEEYEVHG